jgi:hypothetical protein
MNNIYVETMPSACDECPCCNNDVDYGSCCNLGAYDYAECHQTIYRHPNCPLKPLTDRLAEERKKVIGELKIDIRSLFDAYASSLLDYCIWSINAYTHKNLYNNFKRVIKNRLDKVLDLFDKRIDRIERGE